MWYTFVYIYQCSCNIYNCRTQLNNTSMMLISWLNITIIIIYLSDSSILGVQAFSTRGCWITGVWGTDNFNVFVWEGTKAFSLQLFSDLEPRYDQRFNRGLAARKLSRHREQSIFINCRKHLSSTLPLREKITWAVIVCVSRQEPT